MNTHAISLLQMFFDLALVVDAAEATCLLHDQSSTFRCRVLVACPSLGMHRKHEVL